MDNTGAFRVSLPGAAPGDDVLGVWQAQPVPKPAPGRDARSFSGPAHGFAGQPPEEEAEYTLWQVDLPGDPRQAANIIAGQEWRIDQAEQALSAAERRMGRYIEIRQETGGKYAAGTVGGGSFAVGRGTNPEAALDAWLGPGPAGSFGIIPGLPGNWEAVLGQANGLLKRIGQAATYAAWVETSSAGNLIGRTAVGWDGDMSHSMLVDIPARLAVQHQRSLTLALRSRMAWIKMAMAVLSGGLKLAVLAPAGPVAAIPAALQFFRLVIAQAQEIQALHSNK